MLVVLTCTVQGCPTPKVTWKSYFAICIVFVLLPSLSLYVCCLYFSGIQLHPSHTVDMKTTNDKASITLGAVYKEHEGVYTVQLRTHDGIKEHSAFVYVTDASAAVLGGPASPLALQVCDVNKDYVFLSWQPPSADGGSAVEGYYVERYDLSQGKWVRCNVHIQKMCHYPVFGLKEGATYQFRVRAVNKAGAGRPSKATEPIVTADPLEHTRTMGWTITITKDELEGEVKVPFPPTNVHACEVSDTYVVLSWTEPEPRGREPLTFYVERSLAGQNSWELASLDMVVRSPRFPVFDLVKDKQYCFRVRSVNKYGISDPSEASKPISFGKQQAVPAPPHSITVMRDTDTSVELEWKEPREKERILGYYIYYAETGTQDWKTVNNKPITKTRFIVHGLKTGRQYVFRVKSVSRAGNSMYSDESPSIRVKAAINVPSAPSAIALLLCTGSEMVLGWRAPARSGGNPVRGYYLDKREKGKDTWCEVNVKPVRERQLKVCNLTTGHFYQFRVYAANAAGVGKPSEASEAFLCEKWTMPEPGCPYDLEVRDVRNDSVVLLWAPPLYEGQGPVTGYLLEMSQGEQSDNWTTINDSSVSGLQEGQTYRFRVSAVNEAGTGWASLPSEPVIAQTTTDNKNIEIGVDDDGFIFLSYETNEKECVWSKNYTEPIDASRAQAQNKNNRSVLTFMDPSEEDLGLYSVQMSDNLDESSSYDFTDEVIALKSGWQVEVSETGSVRLWLQTESLSNAAELRLIFNDREISSTPHRKINFDKAKGLVEILFDQLSREDEGSYTAQLRDGRAKNQCTLVFVDQSKSLIICFVFQGPYFQEYLSWSVTEECELVMKCKVLFTFHLQSNSSYKRIDQGVRTRPGSSTQKVWLEILNPTESDKGKYTLEMFDGKETHTRCLDLSGQGEWKSGKNRAHVTKGLPDVVAIMEGKSLCLTCFIEGDPTPEVCWLRNDKEIASQDQFVVTKEPKCSTITITNVNPEDSGKYSIFVRNKYGSDTVDVTVSVYKHGEKLPENAVMMS
uniref:Myomesin 3 n=1 Tax=Sphaeramia orbicularis TaxID=375764 RepID=A0A672ZSV8_9TELE